MTEAIEFHNVTEIHTSQMTKAIEFHNVIEINTIHVQLRLMDFCLSH